jgi:hypothetical protein
MTHTNKILIIVVIGLAVFILSEQTGQKEALLGVGEVNVDTSCTWATNVDPQNSRFSLYDNSGAWITMDKDGDGVWEKYGRRSSGTSTQTFSTVISNFNPSGDDITSSNPTHIDLRVESGTSTNFVTFRLDDGAAVDAVIPPCATENETQPPGVCWTYEEMIQQLNDNWVACQV